MVDMVAEEYCLSSQSMVLLKVEEEEVVEEEEGICEES